MLIHPWDAALDEDEWRNWLADGHDFGQLVVNGLLGQPPTVIPTHLTVEDPGRHRAARPPGPAQPGMGNIAADPNVVVTVIDDYAYIPTTWRAKAGGPEEDGVPTSYCAAVQLRCVAEIVDDPTAKADLVTRQLAHFQPTGDHAEVAVGAAKFKYDDHNPTEHRTQVATLLTGRDSQRDIGAANQQRRRLARIGTWRNR